jgi:hypothetical protein
MGYSANGNDMAIVVSPAACTPIYISYLRQTVDPFLDYYVNDSTLQLTYMAQGATVAMPLGCTSRSGVVGPANIVSLTKDFEWHSHDVPSIINELIKALGISLPDELLLNTSLQQAPIIEAE